MKKLSAQLFSMVLLGLPMVCVAQADEWKLTLVNTGTTAKPAYTITSTSSPALGETRKITADVTVTVSCPDNNCNNMTAELMQGGPPKPLPHTSRSGTQAVFSLARSFVTAQEGSLNFKVGEPPVSILPRLTFSGESDANSNPALSAIDCAKRYSFTGSTYSGNTARFIVTSNGNVISRPSEPVDEDDEVEVRVIGPYETLAALQVERISDFGSGGFRILAEDAAFIKKSAGDAPLPKCGELLASISGLSPGRGRIGLFKTGADQRVSVGEFDFVVNPLYRGAFSFGPVYSWLKDESFGTTIRGVDTLVTVTEESPRLHYVLTYTHFLRKRDVEKSKSGWHLNPMIAIPVQRTLKNAFLGATYDVLGSSIYVMGGVHIGRVRVLDGLRPGDRFARPADQLPTTEKTKANVFLGISIDLRAAVKFLSAASSPSFASR